MCDLICDVICSWNCDMGKINVYDKIDDLQPEKKDKTWKLKEFLYKSSSNRWFRNGIHSLLKTADARGSCDIIYRMTHGISLLCRSLIVIDVKK